MSEVAKKIRLQLMQNVRPLWGTEDALQLREQLERTAIEAIYSCYVKCARQGGEPISECYRKCAQQANLKIKYMQVWGKPVPGA